MSEAFADTDPISPYSDSPAAKSAADDLRAAADGKTPAREISATEEKARALKDAAAQKANQLRNLAGAKALDLKASAADKIDALRGGAEETTTHLKGAASTELSFSAKGENEKAGLLVFQNEEHYYLLCQSVSNGQSVVQLFQSEGSALKLLAEEKITSGENLRLKIEAQGNTYAFSFAQKTDDWKTLKDNVDAVFLSTQNAGGFVGCMFALYASANGQASTTTADFDWFEYTGNDATF